MITKEKNPIVLIIFLLCGLVIGGLIGALTKNVGWLSWMSYGQSFGLSNPISLDLGVLQITFGLMFNIDIASIVGIIIAIFLYRKF